MKLAKKQTSLVMIFLVSIALANIYPAFAATIVYPWNGYVFNSTEVDKYWEGYCDYSISEGWARSTAFGAGIFFMESMCGVGYEIYAPQDCDIVVHLTADYYIKGNSAGIGAVNWATAAALLYVVDHSYGDGWTASATLDSEITTLGSFHRFGRKSVSLYFSAYAGHTYWILATARATAGAFISIGWGWAESYIDFVISSISVYPYRYLYSGGCPNLLVWNGTNFVDEGVLPIHNVDNLDADIIYSHLLKTIPKTSMNHYYLLKLSEIALGYNDSHSYIDHVSLQVLDTVGIPRDFQLVVAWHSRLGNVLLELSLSDDIWTETYKGDEIILVFWMRWKPEAASGFVFQIEGRNPFYKV